MAALADAKAVKGKKSKTPATDVLVDAAYRKAGVVRPARGAQVERTATPSRKRSLASSGDETVRVTFPCPKGLLAQVEAEWHGRPHRSLSAAIRALLEKGLGS